MYHMIQQEKYLRWQDEMKHFEKGLFRVHGKVLRYDENSLYILNYKSKIRKAIVWVTESKAFEVAIILFIVLNSLTMALFDYQDRTSLRPYNQKLNQIQLFLTIMFSVEAVLRVLGMGFIVNKNSYVRDPWNWIDLFSIIAGWIEQMPYAPRLKYLRTLRVIRPLRGVKAIPSMKRLINSLLSSLPMMANVVIFLSFFFVLFGILGVSLFKGELRDRCRLTELPENRVWAIDETQQNICSVTGSSYVCLGNTFCGGPASLDDPDSYDNPDYDELSYYGFMNFDHLGYALITVFQVITLEGWSKLMYKMQDSDASFMSPVYFLVFVVFGGFFLLNLILAVILDSFEAVDKQQKVQELQDELKKLDIQHKNTVIGKMRTKGKKGTTYEIGQEPQHEKISYGPENDSSIFTEQYFEDENDEMKSSGSFNQKTIKNQSRKSNLLNNFKDQTEVIEKLKRAKSVYSPKKGVEGSHSVELKNDFEIQKNELQSSLDQGQQGPLPRQDIDLANENKVKVRVTKRIKSKAIPPQNAQNLAVREREQEELDMSKDFEMVFGDSQKSNSSILLKKQDLMLRLKTNKIQKWTYKIVISKFFNFMVYVITILNTLTICLDRYPISQRETNILDTINLACFGFFSIEFILKLLALGPRLYLRDNYNMLDCIVISLQIVDITLKQATTFSSSLLLGFRAAKLLRIFKLAKKWKSFQNLFTKILKSLKDITNFSVLMFIFMFTFAILGMELFAERIKFDENNQPIDIEDCNDQDGCVGRGISPRFNFDKWNNAMISIFVLIIGDDWNSIMFDYVRASSWWSIMYFFCITAFGNIVLLNLFLAILLKDFDYEHEGNSDNNSQDKDLKGTILKTYYYLLEKLRSLKGACRKKKIRKYNLDRVEFDDQSNPDINKQMADPFQVDDSIMMLEQNSYSVAIYHDVDKSREELIMKYDKSQSQKRESYQLSGNEEQGQSLIEDHRANHQIVIKINKNYESNTYSRKNSKAGDTTAMNPNFEDSRARGFTSRGDADVTQQKQGSQNDEEGNIQSAKDPRSRRASGIRSQIVLNQSRSSSQFKFRSNNEQDLNSVNQISDISNQPYKRLESQNLFKKSLTDHLIHEHPQLEGKALYLFSKHSSFRIQVSKLIRHQAFDIVFLIVILTSTVILALDKPLSDPTDSYNVKLDTLDFVLSVLFLIESLLKIVSAGFVLNGERSYLRSIWNVLDFGIVVLSLASQILSDQFKVVKSLRLFRVLRPLRFLSKNEQLKIAVQCLFYSFKDIANVFLITIFVFAVYSIFGVNFYKGNFYECLSDHLPSSLSSQLTIADSFSKWHCISMGGEWKNNRSNFDNVFYGALSLFQMSTTEGWTGVMLNGIDSTKVDYTYEQGRNQWNALYFVFFILLGSQFMINLFVGVIINSFKYEKEKISLNYMLSDTQKEMLMVEIKCLNCKPQVAVVVPSNKCRRVIYELIMSKYFNLAMNLLILCNILLFCFNWYLMSDDLSNTFDYISYSFTGIFTIENILQLIALDKKFFSDGWNTFGLVVVFGTYIQITLFNSLGKSFGSQLTFLRTFRLGRMFKLIKKAHSLNSIFSSFISSLPSLANIGLLLFLLVYLFAILGLNLFAKAKIHGELDDHANFQNFFNAFLTMVRCSTGEGWNDIMKSLMDQRSITYDCVEDPSYDDIMANGGEPNGCGNYWIALFFFCIYQLLVTFIALNLFIAIIIDSFQETSLKQNLRIDDIMLKKFLDAWQQFDPDGSGFINCNELKPFFLELIKQEANFIRGGQYLVKLQNEMSKFIAELHLPVYNNFKSYHMYDVLIHLMKCIFKVDFDKALLLRQEINFEAQSTQQKTNEALLKDALYHQDQMQFDSFEELLLNFNEIIKKHKVQMHEEYKQLKLAADKRKHRLRDKYNQHYYDSRVIIYFPALVRKLKAFTEQMREKRKTQDKQFLRVQAIEEINQIKLTSSPQITRLQNPNFKRNSIFAALARASDQIKGSPQMQSDNSLSPFMGKESSLKSSHNSFNKSPNQYIQRLVGANQSEKIKDNQSSLSNNKVTEQTNHKRHNIHTFLNKIGANNNYEGDSSDLIQKHHGMINLKTQNRDDSTTQILDQFLPSEAPLILEDENKEDFYNKKGQTQLIENVFKDPQSQKSIGSYLGSNSPGGSSFYHQQSQAEFRKGQTQNSKRMSALKQSLQEDIQRGATTTSGLEKLKRIEQEIIIEEDLDCESPLPRIQQVSESNSSALESVRTRKELGRSRKKNSRTLRSGITIQPVKMHSDSQSPIITVTQAREQTSKSSSNASPRNNGSFYSPVSSKTGSGHQSLIASKKNLRKMIPEYLVVKIQPDEVIDEEKSYEETQPQKLQSVNNLLLRNSQNMHSTASKYDFKNLREEHPEEAKRRASLNLHSINNSKLIGKFHKKYKMSSFAIEAMKNIGGLKQSSKDQSSDNRNQSIQAFNHVKESEFSSSEKSLEKISELEANEYLKNQQQQSKGIKMIDKNQIKTQNNPRKSTQLMQNSKLNNSLEQLCEENEDLNQVISPQEFMNSSVSQDLEEIIKNQPFQEGSEYQLSQGQYHCNVSVAQSRKNLQVQTALRKQSDLVVPSNQLTNLRVEESERHFTHSNKKISSNTTQLFFNSFQDIISLSKRSSNKLSSIRYQNALIQSKEEFLEEDEEANGNYFEENRQINFHQDNNAQGERDQSATWNQEQEEGVATNMLTKREQVRLEAEEEKKALVQNQARTREAKLRELLNIDIDSSEISSDLYLDEGNDNEHLQEQGKSRNTNNQAKGNLRDEIESVSISEELSNQKTLKGLKAQNFDSPLSKFGTVEQIQEIGKQENHQNEEMIMSQIDFSKPLQNNKTIKPQLMILKSSESSSSSQSSPIQTSELDKISQELGPNITLGKEKPVVTVPQTVKQDKLLKTQQKEKNQQMHDRFWIKLNRNETKEQHQEVKPQSSQHFLSLSEDEFDDDNFFKSKDML